MTLAAPWASSPGAVEVNVEEAAAVDPALAAAVDTVREAADRHQTGILIVRNGPGRYTVRAHPAVPYGLTRQIDERAQER